jgi:cobaltochelatase CobN
VVTANAYLTYGGEDNISNMLLFLGQDRNNMSESKVNKTGITLIKTLNAPVFEPVLSNHMTLDEWENGIGLSNDIG